MPDVITLLADRPHGRSRGLAITISAHTSIPTSTFFHQNGGNPLAYAKQNENSSGESSSSSPLCSNDSQDIEDDYATSNMDGEDDNGLIQRRENGNKTLAMSAVRLQRQINGASHLAIFPSPCHAAHAVRSPVTSQLLKPQSATKVKAKNNFFMSTIWLSAWAYPQDSTSSHCLDWSESGSLFCLLCNPRLGTNGLWALGFGL